MRPEKILVGEGKILLADKIIYVAVEFTRLAEAYFYIPAQAPGMPSGRQGLPHDTTFELANDEYSHSRNNHFRTLQKHFRLTPKLHRT